MSIRALALDSDAASAEPRLVALPDRIDLVCLCVLAVLVGGVDLAVTRQMVSAGSVSDFGFHIQLAAEMAPTRQISTPEFLYHVTTIGLVVLATVAKPNYTLCLLPALALLVAVRLWHHQPIDWLLLVGFVGPALAVLAWQYSLTYGSGSSIVFAPFAVFLSFTSANSLLPKLILSVLFPLGVYLLYFRAARRALYLNLCWVVFLVSLGFNYLLAESGDRPYHANFAWGAQAALFILFVASARFWILQLREPRQPGLGRYQSGRAFLLAGILGLHLVSGLLWYYTQLTLGQTGWW